MLALGVGVFVVVWGWAGHLGGLGVLFHWDWGCARGGLNWRVRILLERE